MKMIITLLEDTPTEIQHFKDALDIWSKQNNFDIELSVYSSGEDFFEKTDANTYSSCCVYFLDIQMSGMTGLDVAKKLRKNEYKGAIIFLTAFREYVFHGYDVHAMNYLLKPIHQTSLFSCLDEIASDLIGSSYLYRNKQEIIHIPYKEILIFSSNLHYVDIMTVSANFCQYSTLNNIIEYLPKEFIRVHRFYIVNMFHIDKICGNTIVLSNHMTVPIVRSYMKHMISSFTEYSLRFE